MRDWKKWAAAGLAAFAGANLVMGWLGADVMATLVAIAASIGVIIPSSPPVPALPPEPKDPPNPFGLRSRD